MKKGSALITVTVVTFLLIALVGSLFVGRAITLWRQLREARAQGTSVPAPILHDAIDR